MSKLVQVFLPNYNGGIYIGETIQSILNQTYLNFELHVVDNNSTDNSIEIIEKFNDGRLIIHKFNELVPIGENFNRCLKLVSAEFFCFAHSDDVYEPNFIEEMLEGLLSFPNSLMAHSNFNCIDSRGQNLIENKYQLKKKLFSKDRFITQDPSLEFNKLICGNYILCPSMFFRGKIIEVNGYFDNKLKFALDWDYSLRLLLSGFSIVRVSRILVNYRISNVNTTILEVANNNKYEEHLNLLLKHKSRLTNAKFIQSLNRLNRVIIWDIKEDLLRKKYNFALNKYLFLKSNRLSGGMEMFLLKVLIHLKYIGGKILHFLSIILTSKFFYKNS